MPEAHLRIDHLALPSYDPEATHRFWSEQLGLKPLGVFEGTSDLWGGRRFLLSTYDAGGGSILDFFCVEGLARPEDDPHPVGMRHVALGVESRAALYAWKRRLESHGSWVSELVDHGGTHDSIYCFDPNGLQVELTFRPQPLEPLPPEGMRSVLRRWAEARP
jgi:catechol 2,3-dioxygenase-like lactoylglutathione lyase family enzyme